MNRTTILCAVLSVLFLAGCGNTLNGMGHDIERMGQHISNTF